MALPHADEIQKPEILLIQNNKKYTTTTSFPLVSHCRCKIQTRWRRRKVPSIRLGGEKKKKFSLVKVKRLFRRIKIKWIKLQYTCMLNKLKKMYYSVVKDLIEAGATLENVQQRILMEAYYTVPIMGISGAGATAVRSYSVSQIKK